MNYEIVKNVKIKYSVNDQKTVRVYPVNGHDSHNIVLDILLLINNYGISDLSVELSKPYITSKNKVFERDELLDNLTSSIRNDLGANSTLKLTK